MYRSWSRLLFATMTIAVTTFLLISCAAPQKAPTPEPIATSLDQMPGDIATVVTAIQQRIIGYDVDRASNVRFANETASAFAETWSFLRGFAPAGTQLYTYETVTDDPAAKTGCGRLDFEGPLGRRASALYETRFRPSADDLMVEENQVNPVYSDFPEPIMFVVPADVLPTTYPGNYPELLEFVGERAVNPLTPESISPEKSEYTIFVFLLDRISPSSKLEVKISNEKTGIRGYKESTMYIDFNGWRVALLSGRFTLFDPEGTNPLYVKAILTPGQQARTKSRAPKPIGLFCLDGSRPKP